MASSGIRAEMQRRRAEMEIIRRADRWESLRVYAEMIFAYHYRQPLRRTWWDELFYRALMDVYLGEVNRLVIEMPPRHGKTERAVRLFSSFAQGVEPSIKFQYATYGADLSVVVSTETKKLMESGVYRQIFPEVGFDKSLNTKTHWMLGGLGGFLGTSVGGAITGMGADVAIIDDILKATEAHSPPRRKESIQFYQSSVLSRLEGRKAVIVIMQRLHEEDLIGYVTREEGLAEEGGAWHRLSLPVINDWESFDAFYGWIEGSGDASIDPSERRMLETQAARTVEEEYAARYPDGSRVSAHERSIWRTKRERVVYYELARTRYLEDHPLPDTPVRYRDTVVMRPPLTPLDPEEYGLDFVVAQRRGMSLAEFKRQYMQDPENKEAGYFTAEYWREVADVEIPRQNVYILVDNAESEEAAADDRGIVAVGKSIDASKIVTTVVMDGRFGKWDVYGTCARIIDMMLLYPDAPVWIEGAGGGLTMAKVLRREMLAYNAKAQAAGKPQVRNAVQTYKPDNQLSKNAGIKLLAAPYEQGYLVIRRGADEAFKAQLRKEMLAFNPERKANTDNLIDPLSKSFTRSEIIPLTLRPPREEPIRRSRRRKSSGTRWRGV